ncbi:MAG: hypothetical protein AB8B96_08660 [Lysobacterales bacterium]
MKKIIVGVVVELQAALGLEDTTLLEQNFSAFETAPAAARAQISVAVKVHDDQYQVSWLEADNDGVVTSTRAELVYNVEGFVVLGLQLARPDLLFLHGAVLRSGARGMVLTGASGNGKSTLCWALTQHDCQYLSDELAPLKLGDSATVAAEAYSHSLNLKKSPPGSYQLPPDIPHTGWTFHIPPSQLAGGYQLSDSNVHAIFLVQYDPAGPAVDRLPTAEAVFRLYPNVLNGLAHPASGLTMVKEICRRLPVYDLKSNNLKSTSELVLETLHQ